MSYRLESTNPVRLALTLADAKRLQSMMATHRPDPLLYDAAERHKLAADIRTRLDPKIREVENHLRRHPHRR